MSEENCFFSIVVPAYNAGQYIEACVNSLERQTLRRDYYEIIVVNDGSTDDTRDKVESLSHLYDNLILVNQENLNIGGARNTGIRASRGKYILFCDADDSIVYSDALAVLKKYLEQHPVRLLKSRSYTSIFEIKDTNLLFAKLIEVKLMTSKEYLLSEYFSYPVWNGVYKRDLFTNDRIYFSEKCFYEELDFSVRVAHVITDENNVGVCEFPFYGYCENEKSATHELRGRMFFDNLKALIRLMQFAKDTEALDIEISQFVYLRCRTNLISLSRRMYRYKWGKDEFFKAIKKWKLCVKMYFSLTNDTRGIFSSEILIAFYNFIMRLLLLTKRRVLIKR